MNSVGKLQKVDVAAIVQDDAIQMRQSINQEVVDEYAETFQSLPPVTVVYDGVSFWLTDGFHRFRAALKLGKDRVLCEVIDGTRRDAIFMACGANIRHGLRRTNADKKRAVLTLLEDEEWSKMSNRKIAECAGASSRFVDKIRNELEQANESSDLKVDGGVIEDDDNGGDVAEPSIDTDDKWEDVECEEDVEGEDNVEIEPLIDDKRPWKKNVQSVDMFRRRVLELIRDIDELERDPGKERIYDNRKLLVRDLTTIKNNIAGCIPAHECPYCMGHDSECNACRGRGWLASHEYNQVPEDIRNEAKRLSTGGRD